MPYHQIYFGFEVALSELGAQFFVADTAETEQQRRMATFSPFTGEIRTIFAVDPKQQRVFSRQQDPACALAFSQWLQEAHAIETVQLVGFGAMPFCRQLALQANQQGGSLPLSFWQEPHHEHVDPYAVCLSAGLQKLLPHGILLRHVGLDLPTSWRPHLDAQQDCRLSVELSGRLRLFPVPSLNSQLQQLLVLPETPASGNKPRRKIRRGAE